MIQKILDATTKRTKIKIDYVDREGERTTRIIRPYHVFKWHSNTYFMGFCEFDNDIRIFKISRLRKLEVLNNQFSDKILSLREYMDIPRMEAYFRGMTRAGMDWNTKISPQLTDVKVHIMSIRYTVPEIYFADSLDEDMKIVLYARILQIYGTVFSDAIKALKKTFAGDARELAQNILTGEAFWNRFDKKCEALCEEYNIEMEISFDDTKLSDELFDEIKAKTEERQRQFIHSRLARKCPWCRKYFIPSGSQAYKQIYCSESRRRGKGSQTERGCKEYAKDRRNYLRRKSTLIEEEKEELQRLSAKPEFHTKSQWEAKIRQVLRQLGFPDNHGWVPVDKAEEVEILEKQLKS